MGIDKLFGENKAQKEARRTAAQQRAHGAELFNQARPIREEMTQRYTDFMHGGMDPTASPMWAPAFNQMKQGNEQQWGMAQQGLLDHLPQGGVLQDQMANLQYQKAGSMEHGMNNLLQQILADEYAKAYGFATGTPQISGQFYGGAQSGFNNAANTQAYTTAQNQQMLSGLGIAFGTK
jgi:hypothetical protein